MTHATPRGPRPATFRVQAHHEYEATVDVCDADLFDVWLSTVGPTAALVWQYLARLSRQGEFEMTPEELSEWSGASIANVWNAVDRLVMFGRCHWYDGERLSVALTATQPRRLSPVATRYSR